MLLKIELPDGIEPPKFKLFERVIHDGRENAVVGIHYTLPWLQGVGGWEYELDPIFPLWQDAGCPDYGDGEYIREDELKRPRKASKAKTDSGPASANSAIASKNGLTHISEVLPAATQVLGVA